MRTKPVLAVVFAVAGSAVAGGAFGARLLATQDRVPEHYRVFTTALAAIESQYAEKVESDRLVYGAINGMLQTLDPHSSFMDPKSYAQMRERQEGRYYGLGVTIQAPNGDITAVRVFEGSPAHDKGIRRGDVIAEIEGTSTKGWTTDDAVAKLRGPKGTHVNIGIRRKGLDALIPMAVMRDQVSIPSLSAVFMIDEQTGYVGITDFAEHTDEDLGTALEALTKRGMKRLVLDLRSNPGGQLDQAIRITNRFVPKGSMVVYTRGRVANSDQDYRASEAPGYTNLPMITLVNRSSASASEIVSGALQDYDRSLIIGETTFGKALVQSVYRVSGGAGLALTTARYYTPSGRLIQRPWDGTFDEYLTYTMKDQGQRTYTPDQLKYTTGGRKVYSGGGIEPDERVDGPLEGFSPTRFSRSVYNRGLFLSFAEQFFYEGDTRPGSKAPTFKYVKKDFEVTQQMVDDFKAFVISRNTKMDEDAWAKDLPFIRAMIRFEIDQAVFDIATARRRLITADPQAGYALTRFGEAERLAEMSRNRPAKPAQGVEE
ncbi:MAG: S41 family peptidase [Acidobacteria bacterium]|nr:S41 family peptidase [Acidobacteriota bacterium]